MGLAYDPWMHFLLVAALAAGTAPASPLESKLAELAGKSASTVGLFVHHLERGERAGLNAARPFPMASTFKLPLAVVVLREMERNELPPLDGKVRLVPADMFRWASWLWPRMPNGGEVTLQKALSLLLEGSDNSAANALLRLAGGAKRVRAELAALGLDGISVDRDETEMALDSVGIAHPTRSEWTWAKFTDATTEVTRKQRQAGLERFRNDPRDRATPQAMARVLERIWRGEMLSRPHLAFLRDELALCHTGPRRLRAGVPPDTLVAHRTGTCPGLGEDDSLCVNDVGVIALPRGEHVIVAAFVEDAGGDVDAKEQLIAKLSHAVWEHYALAR